MERMMDKERERLVRERRCGAKSDVEERHSRRFETKKGRQWQRGSEKQKWTHDG